MSAAAARRKKQLAARAAASAGGEKDVVIEQLDKLLNDSESLSEEVAYEALQLAQSSIRKRIQTDKFQDGCDLAYSSALKLLQKGRVSVASQLLQLLAEILRETHTAETEEWISRIVELHKAHENAIQTSTFSSTEEVTRLQRLQKNWLLLILKWSSELGMYQYGHNAVHELLANHCWITSKDCTSATSEEQEELTELQCDAIQHMTLAEKPKVILEWLKMLPKPTGDEIKSGHECPPALRDMLLTRSVLLFVAVENLRDANVLIRDYMNEIEERDIKELAKSYTSKDDGVAPSHIIFCCMLVRICEKDTRTGPLFQWLMKSFKRNELDKFPKNNAIQSYCTKIGKIYFNIEPPPSMLRMMESMMGGMGGGMGGIDPAMMQAALASMQQG